MSLGRGAINHDIILGNAEIYANCGVVLLDKTLLAKPLNKTSLHRRQLLASEGGGKEFQALAHAERTFPECDGPVSSSLRR